MNEFSPRFTLGEEAAEVFSDGVDVLSKQRVRSVLVEPEFKLLESKLLNAVLCLRWRMMLACVSDEYSKTAPIDIVQPHIHYLQVMFREQPFHGCKGVIFQVLVTDSVETIHR